MSNSSIKTTIQNFKKQQTEFCDKHPVKAPVVYTVSACATGGVLGMIMPVDADSFVTHSLCEEADRCSEKAFALYNEFMNLKEHSASSEVLVDKLPIVNENVKKVRITLGDEVFNKLKAFFNKPMSSDAQNMTSLEVKQKRQEYIENILADFSEYKKGNKNIAKKYSNVVKEVRKSNAKNLALILGLSTAVITGLYSYIKHHDKKQTNKA